MAGILGIVDIAEDMVVDTVEGNTPKVDAVQSMAGRTETVCRVS